MIELVYTCHFGAGKSAGPLPRFEVLEPAREGSESVLLAEFDCYGSDQEEALHAIFVAAVEKGVARWAKGYDRRIPTAAEAHEGGQ
jgi:hypothetical protein